MRRHAFATLISYDGALHISHLPLVLLADRGNKGTLLGHMARANNQWRDFDGQRPVTCIFHGPHAYVSPSWYRDQPAVPTWNYAVVHATGRPRAIETPEALDSLVCRTIAEFEPALLDPSAASHPPAAYRASLLQQIVGFEIAIEELNGKFKLGQNRSPQDRQGITNALAERGEEQATALLDLMSERGLAEG